jgi:beta-lysine 5,6-aminomutase beta subunit
VSKVVSQHNIHIRDLKDLIARAEKMGIREKMIFVSGGPRLTHPMALECGFDAGFGVGTKPSDVASYIVEEVLRRMEEKHPSQQSKTLKSQKKSKSSQGSAASRRSE